MFQTCNLQLEISGLFSISELANTMSEIFSIQLKVVSILGLFSVHQDIISPFVAVRIYLNDI
jgi:hypothetical protein